MFPLESFIGSTFGSLSENMDSKWLRSYGGHCGCILFDVDDIKLAGSTENILKLYSDFVPDKNNIT